MVGEGLGSFWDNLGLTLDPISFPCFFLPRGQGANFYDILFSAMFATLKGLAMVYNPAISLQWYLFLRGLKCLGETVRSYILNSY